MGKPNRRYSRGTAVNAYVTFTRGDEDIEAHVSGTVTVEGPSNDSPGDCDIDVSRITIDDKEVSDRDVSQVEYDACIQALADAYADGGWDDVDDYEPDHDRDDARDW